MRSHPRRIASSVPVLVALALCGACRSASEPSASERSSGASAGRAEPTARRYLLERVDDVGVVQLYADGFERLSLRDKTLAWHLYQAVLAGRDIFLQQKCRDGLAVRDLVEEILTHPDGVEPATLENVRRYAKLFWVNNSPYNAITARKNVMQGTSDELARAAEAAERSGAHLPRHANESAAALVARLAPLLFDPEFEPMVVAKNPEGGRDVLEASAVTFYGEGVKLPMFEGFHEEYELNSNVELASGSGGGPQLVEQVWRAGDLQTGVPAGLYAREITSVIGHLEDARRIAPEPTRRALEALIRFYRTGKREDRVAYDVAWVADKDSAVDTVNGFIEVYLDPRGKKGGWEGIVSYEDPKKADLIQKIASSAQWFEDHMPYEERFRKPNVKGISARSIDVVIEAGDSGPVTPVGINLPNDQAIREQNGSKSVSLANVVEAYDKSSTPAARREFCFDDAEAARAERWVALTSDLLTNMHEVIGHASGRQAEDHAGDPSTWIQEYYSALEEGRADLVALYFMMDPKLAELGLLGDPAEAALAAYEQYTRNGGLQQLRRVKRGNQLEEDHMKNRQMVVRWIQHNSDAIAERERDGKHYLVVTSARAWREAAGKLLALVQRIKSTGDRAGAKELFDTYGISFDPALRDEVLARYSTLDVPAYIGFVMPRLTPVTDATGAISDVRISYPLSIEQQMLEWSGRRRAPSAP